MSSRASNTAAILLDRCGQTYGQLAGIRLRNTPAPLFQLLCLALLFSARIRASVALHALQAVLEAGWTTPEKLARSTWARRVRVLDRTGYARYDERTATMLGQTADLLRERYRGDLRRLREGAGRDPAAERERLREFKGIGDVGVDIFFREVQAVWPEIYPFADARALEGAARLGLPENPAGLAALVPRDRFPHLVTALVRVQLEKRLYPDLELLNLDSHR